MKPIILSTIMLLLSGSPQLALSHHGGPVTYRVFHHSLSPYGEWVRWNGVHVWRPWSVSADWQPYTVGRWAWTSDGWYWVSHEPWGWATYHYGRWHYDDYYGWVWFPDYEWAPAWVDWRCGGDYVGWAPMGPVAGVHVSIHFGPQVRGPRHSPWSFVHYSHMAHHNLKLHFVPRSESRRYFGSTRSAGNTQVRNGRVIGAGPDIVVVEQRGKVRVDRIDREAHERNRPVERDRMAGERKGGRKRG